MAWTTFRSLTDQESLVQVGQAPGTSDTFGGYHGSLLSFGPFGAGGSTWGIIRLTIAWLYLNGWSAYGVEVCATFAPEYHDTKRDTAVALNRSAIFSLLVYTLLPLGLGTGSAGGAGSP